MAMGVEGRRSLEQQRAGEDSLTMPANRAVISGVVGALGADGMLLAGCQGLHLLLSLRRISC